jgi:glycosyltransferase involved in cell wall biosynthesis
MTVTQATAGNDTRQVPEAGVRSLLLVGNFLSRHGMGSRQVCEELAARLVAAGVGTITTSTKPGRAERLADMVQTAWSRRDSYEVAQVDVFSGASFVWAEAVCWTLRRAGRPYVLSLHGGALPEFFARWPRRGRRLLRSAAAVTVPSGFLLERIRPYHEDLVLLPNAIELPAYPWRQRSVAAPRLVWLRAFHEIYNPVLAPRVVALLAPEFPAISMTMTGADKDGSLDRARGEARRLGVEDRIRFRGAVPKDEVPAAMVDGDIYLNTTSVDNMPVTLIEAMACGTCVVSTGVGGVPYLVRDGVNGLLCPPDDAPAMAALVRRVLNEPALARTLAAEGRRTAEAHDWNVVLPQWLELLSDAAGGRRR